ncbi:MAG: PQQ-binding-like beta-propeller repeat protein [Spirochaetia bacterium]
MKAMVSFFFMLALAISLPAQTPSWPQWRGPAGNNTSAETDWDSLALRDGAKVLWMADLGFGYSGIAIKDNRLYAAGRTSRYPHQLAYYCMDASTGRVIWKSLFDNKGVFPQSTPAIDGDRLYALNDDGLLRCLQAADGKLVWGKNLQVDFHIFKPGYDWSTSPVVEGRLLLLSANSRGLALDKSNGDLVWAIDDTRQEPSGNPDLDGVASVVVADFQEKRVAVFSLAATIVGVDVATGDKLWSYTLKSPGVIHDPVVSGGRVLITDWSILLEPGADVPKEVWISPTAFGSWPAPVLIGGYLYGTDFPNGFSPGSWGAFQYIHPVMLCMDWTTGNVVWKKAFPWVELTTANGKLIALELNGTLHIGEVSPSGYTELSSADVFGGAKKQRTFAAPPVLCNGKIYCRNSNGELLCIDVGK